MNEYTAADVNEIQPVTTKAVGEVDALYVPTDNLFAENMPTAALVAENAKIPVICGESGIDVYKRQISACRIFTV